MTRIPNNVLAFAQDEIDVYKDFRDYYNHYKTENRLLPLGKTVSFDNTIDFEEKEGLMHKALLAEIQRVSGISSAVFNEVKPEQIATNPNFKWAVFAVISYIIDMVLPDSLIDSIGLFTDIRFGGFGDSFDFEVEPRDIFSSTVAGRGKRRSEIQKQYNGQVTIKPIEHDITVGVNLYKVLCGKESLAKFVMKAAKGMETDITYNAYDAFNTAMNALDNTGDDALRISGYTQATAIDLAQKIEGWNTQNAMFVGTKLALANILPSNTNYRYDIESAFVKNGYIKDFNGFSTMELRQKADYKTEFKLKLTNESIYIISPSSQKLLKLVIEGSTISIPDTVYANADLQQAVTLKRMYNTGIATNALAGIIEL